MSGIAGFLLTDPGARPDARRLQAMVDALVHRGPDDSGYLIDGPVGLGMRRLAIIDPIGGHQPIANEDRTIHVVYDGECYNLGEVRAELERAGHRFATNSDAEIVVHGYEEWGVRDLVRRLNGIFAFCVWDDSRRIAYLVCDRLGVKPLYYIARASGVGFASELRALARSGLCLPKLDEESVWRYLRYQFAPTERTLLAGVLRLPAAHLLEWRAGAPIRIERYWSRPQGGPRSGLSLETAADEVQTLLEDAVRRQLVGDVPIGCFLSGGMASAAVATLMARHTRQPLRTYAIGFPTSPDDDETAAVLQVARAIGAQHTTVAFTEDNLADQVDAYLARVDEPTGDAAMLPTYLLAAAAAHDVTVVLTGESADEAFPSVLEPEAVWCLLDQNHRPSFDTFRRVVADVEPRAGDVLMRLDKATMAHGLQSRVPMLDHRLVELTATLPVLAPTRHRGGVPLDTWLRGPLAELAQTLVQDSTLVADGVLDRDGVARLLDAHRRGHAPSAHVIWALLNLDAWWRHTRADVVAALPADGAIPVLSSDRVPTVDIVIPVAGGLSLARDCIRSIRAWTARPFHAIVVHDGGDDDAHARLRALFDGDERFDLVRNIERLGYVGSCARGMSMSRADYVVLLNSDTVVTPSWLDRMVTCAESDPRIAIVNPLTNESGNTSVRMAPGLNLLTMARRVAVRSRRTYPDVTTAVGMCMLIRRSAIDLLGGFDAVFTDAYCEESDLCMRFTEAGLRVVVADDAFIYHKGNGSYSEARRQALYERNRSIFDARWAVAYERDWTNYARADPLQYMRNALLSGTTTEDDSEDTRTDVEHDRRRLDTQRAIAAVAGGARARAAAIVLGDRGRPGARANLIERGIDHLRQPRARFEERTVAFPTRQYVDGLPAPDPGTLRITFLVSSFPLSGGIIQIVQLARAFLAAGHDVKFVTESRFIEPELLNLWTQPLLYRDRQHVLDAFPESDVVVATYWTTAHDYLAELRRRYEFTSVYYVQDYEAWFYDETAYETRRDVMRSYAAAEHVIVMSRWLKDKVDRHGVACEIVPLGLDLGVFYPRPGVAAARPRVLAIISPDASARRRGFPETVEAFRRVHAERPDVELMLLGRPADVMPPLPFPYTNAGRVYDPNRVAEIVSSADVLVDVSQWQGFGRPGLEAMACGTVPVLTNQGGILEYARDQDNCLLVNPVDAEATTAAILCVLADPPLYQRLRAGGLATAARFSHEAEAAQHLSLYRRWAAEAAASSAARHLRYAFPSAPAAKRPAVPR